MPACRVQHREQHREAGCCSRPTARRRGLGACARIDERLHLDQQRPRAFLRDAARTSRARCCACCDRNSADGFATPRRPRSVMANTPSSLTAPKRFLIARAPRRNDECVSPSKYSTVSTICSSTRAARRARPPSVTWPTGDDRGARLLGDARQLRRALAHLRDRAGRGDVSASV